MTRFLAYVAVPTCSSLVNESSSMILRTRFRWRSADGYSALKVNTSFHLGLEPPSARRRRRS